MTEKQANKLYWPLWRGVQECHGWMMRKGRLMGKRAEGYGSTELTRIYNTIWDSAELIARGQHRAVTDADLRHGCHVAAFGMDASHSDLDNQEVDRIKNLFLLLADPNNLDAAMEFEHPEIGQRKRYQVSIRERAAFKDLDQICRDKFGRIYQSPFWEDLPDEELKQLYLTVRGWQSGGPRHRSAGQSGDEERPFKRWKWTDEPHKKPVNFNTVLTEEAKNLVKPEIAPELDPANCPF